MLMHKNSQGVNNNNNNDNNNIDNYLMYMDDIKLFAKSEKELETRKLIRIYSQDRRMETTNNGKNRTTKSRKIKTLGVNE